MPFHRPGMASQPICTKRRRRCDAGSPHEHTPRLGVRAFIAIGGAAATERRRRLTSRWQAPLDTGRREKDGPPFGDAAPGDNGAGRAMTGLINAFLLTY